MVIFSIIEKPARITFIDHCTGFVKVEVDGTNIVRWLSGISRPVDAEVGMEGVLLFHKFYYGTSYEFVPNKGE